MGNYRSVLAIATAVGVTVLIAGACDDSDSPRTVPSASPSVDGKQSPGKRDGREESFDARRLRLGLDVVAEAFENPLFVTHAGDGSGRLFVVEQVGRIQVLDGGGVEPFLDISHLTDAVGEQGLLGLAFHPDYERNGLFYVDYTDAGGDTVVAEYRVRTPADDRADQASERVLLRIDQPFSNHNGGALVFGPDGFLYIGTGDGGSGGDPMNNGQRINTLLGKLLRVDVDDKAPYSIPTDNPFTEEEGARGEIWAYGLRNPWRFSFDEPTNTLWIGDVGQGRLEEIDRVPAGRAGLNFGWNVMEGDECFAGSCDPEDYEPPVAVYERDSGACSVTGGYVYRGSDFPAMRGGYFFGDFCSGQIWALDAEKQGPQQEVEVLATEHAISSFGLDEKGELYVTDLSAGLVLRLVDRAPD